MPSFSWDDNAVPQETIEQFAHVLGAQNVRLDDMQSMGQAALVRLENAGHINEPEAALVVAIALVGLTHRLRITASQEVR